MVSQVTWADPGGSRGHPGALASVAGGLPDPARPDTDSRRATDACAEGLGQGVCAGGWGRAGRGAGAPSGPGALSAGAGGGSGLG